jgi:hypothetical protein
MSYPWQPFEGERGGSDDASETPDPIAAWSELFATTIAHLAAQLTMTQLRLRALASIAAESGAIDTSLVAARLSEIAEREGAGYLRENLGAELAEAIDLDDLARDIVSYLRGEAAGA